MVERQTGTITDMVHSSIYLKRYAYPIEFLSDKSVPYNLGSVVVIPAYNEKDIVPALHSLDSCYPPKKPVEILVVINQPENCIEEVSANNQACYKQVMNFKHHKTNDAVDFHAIMVKDLPVKYAGVGLARKIGMDEAVRRFHKADNPNGVILNFDADCTCDRNYLQCIEEEFADNNIYGASIYFEHPLNESYDSHIVEGIIQYELHLRYFVHALRFSGFPYAFHTVGSCMAVRSDIYQKQGGMNRRKAGEDFYFLQKIIPLGNYSEINGTRVYPSHRSSGRVPFGTGKAMTEWILNQNKDYYTYSPQVFEDLQALLSDVDVFFNNQLSSIEQKYEKLPRSIKEFIPWEEFSDNLIRCKNESAYLNSFRQKFFAWLNGLQILRYIHFCRDRCYPNVTVREAVEWISRKIFKEERTLTTLKEWLLYFRDKDRTNPVRSDQKGLIYPVSFQR